MPSMPMLSTPAFSEICSPKPASSKGTPAVTAPNSSAVRKGWVSRPSISAHLLAANVIEVFARRQEDQQQRPQHQHEMLRHADSARRTVAADHQRREEEGEADHTVAVEPRQEDQRHDQQAEGG